MTAACGLARSFTQLFLARIGVGVGEAALSPAAYSMIADIFPKKKLGRALGIYSSGVYLGTGLAFALGGVLVASIAEGPPRSLPLIGEVAPWQLTFLIVGPTRAAGRSPDVHLRRAVAPHERRQGPKELRCERCWTPSISTAPPICCTSSVSRCSRLLFNGTMGLGCPSTSSAFTVSSAGPVGLILGLIVMTLGSAGIICGGLLSDRLSARGDLAAPITAALWGTVFLLPLGVAAPLVGSATLSMALFAPLLFFSSFPFGPAQPPRSRSSPRPTDVHRSRPSTCSWSTSPASASGSTVTAPVHGLRLSRRPETAPFDGERQRSRRQSGDRSAGAAAPSICRLRQDQRSRRVRTP